MPYWFNVNTRQVESDDDPERAKASELLGPYETEDEASAALETARKNTEAWDEAERKEREWESGDSEGNAWDNNPLNG